MATTNIFAVILLLLIAIVNAADDTKSDDRWVVYYSGDFDKSWFFTYYGWVLGKLGQLLRLHS